jgi:hypothetical protein
MNDNPALTRAYELIEADRLDEAQTILKPILDNDPNNADAWWLYAHAVTDADSARTALNNLKRLEPDYPGAADLLQTLDEKYPAARPTMSRIERLEPLRAAAPSMPSTLPGLSTDDDDEPDFGDLDEEDEEPVQPKPAGANRRPLLLIGALIVIVLLIVAILLLNPFKPAPAETATPTGQVAADNPTSTVDSSTAATTGAQSAPTDFPTLTEAPTEQSGGETPTLEPTTGVVDATATLEQSAQEASPTLEGGSVVPETTIDTFSTLLPAFSQFTLPDNSISIQQTELGQTLLVSVCTAAGASLRTTLPQVMDVAARQVGQATGQIDAIGTRLVDCQNNNAPLRTIAVSSADAQAYAGGSLTEEAFQAKWRAIR